MDDKEYCELVGRLSVILKTWAKDDADNTGIDYEDALSDLTATLHLDLNEELYPKGERK